MKFNIINKFYCDFKSFNATGLLEPPPEKKCFLSKISIWVLKGIAFPNTKQSLEIYTYPNFPHSGANWFLMFSYSIYIQLFFVQLPFFGLETWKIIFDIQFDSKCLIEGVSANFSEKVPFGNPIDLQKFIMCTAVFFSSRPLFFYAFIMSDDYFWRKK